MLKRGVTHSNDPFHFPVLGTRGKEGCNLRTVILRQFILPDRILVCYSDARATKAQDIGHYSKVSWLFYHPEKAVQLRISGQAKCHTDDQFADDKWAATKITSRLDYSTTHPPGTPVDKPSKVPTDDSTDIKNVSCSDKLDNKLSNKPETNPELTEIIAAWPKLPEAVRLAIVAAVRASARLFF